jgi:cellulose biosynthesis protein BcsQ
MKNTLIIASEKGGAGKTFCARVISDLLRKTGKLRVYDGDPEVGELGRFLASKSEVQK